MNSKRNPNSILSLLGALGAFNGAGPKVTAIGPNGKSADIESEEDFKQFLQNEGLVAAAEIVPDVERDGELFRPGHNHPLASIFDHKTSPSNGDTLGAKFAQLSALLASAPSPGGPDYRIPRGRGPRRLPWETRGCGNPECPIHGNRCIPHTPDDRGAVLTLSGAIEVEADYSEDPAAKGWIAWVRANYGVAYVRCGKCGAVTHIRYWNEFDLHDCVRKLPCLRCGAPFTQVTVDGNPDGE